MPPTCVCLSWPVMRATAGSYPEVQLIPKTKKRKVAVAVRISRLPLDTSFLIEDYTVPITVPHIASYLSYTYPRVSNHGQKAQTQKRARGRWRRKNTSCASSKGAQDHEIDCPKPGNSSTGFFCAVNLYSTKQVTITSYAMQRLNIVMLIYQ